MVKNYIEVLLEGVEGLADEDKETLATSLPVKNFGKGYHLLRQGDTYRECFYIFKGCVRQYFLGDGGKRRLSHSSQKAIRQLSLMLRI